MFKKLFGSNPDDQADPAQVERGLAILATRVPSVRWAALVSVDGLIQGIFPSQVNPGADRIAAMSAAMLSLGERITNEFQNGGLRYALMGGEKGGSLLIVLSPRRALSLGLEQDAAIQSVLAALRVELVPLLSTLHIEDLPWLSSDEGSAP